MQYEKLKELIAEHKKEWTLVAITLIATGILVSGFYFLPKLTNKIKSANTSVPEEFLSARSRAGDAADRISQITDTYGSSIERIREAEKNGEFRDGLSLILDEVNRNEEVRVIAEDLSIELSGMAQHLAVIQPPQASEVALNAITTGIELVQHLISYNNTTRDLLYTLELRFSTGDDEETREKIEELITDMNEEADVINNLGSEYRGLMIQFDALTA